MSGLNIVRSAVRTFPDNFLRFFRAGNFKPNDCLGPDVFGLLPMYLEVPFRWVSEQVPNEKELLKSL